MNWISSFELFVIHEKVIEGTGSSKGVLNFSNLARHARRLIMTIFLLSSG